jgi:prevent-host-death family protein
MCYMKHRDRQVGVRELRQNLTVYLRRVTAGETLEVTDRGRPVALLTGLPAVTSPLRRLVAAGKATMPKGDLLELGLPPKPRKKLALSEALEREREERL